MTDHSGLFGGFAKGLAVVTFCKRGCGKSRFDDPGERQEQLQPDEKQDEPERDATENLGDATGERSCHQNDSPIPSEMARGSPKIVDGSPSSGVCGACAPGMR